MSEAIEIFRASADSSVDKPWMSLRTTAARRSGDRRSSPPSKLERSSLFTAASSGVSGSAVAGVVGYYLAVGLAM